MAAFKNVLEEFVEQRDSFSRPDDGHLHPGFVLSLDLTAFREFTGLELADWHSQDFTSVTQGEIDILRGRDEAAWAKLREILVVLCIKEGVKRMTLTEKDGATAP